MSLEDSQRKPGGPKYRTNLVAISENEETLRPPPSRSTVRHASTKEYWQHLEVEEKRRKKEKHKLKEKSAAFLKFRRIARFVTTCVQWCFDSYKSNEAAKYRFISFSQIDTDESREGLMFDINFFRANRESRLSNDARTILQKDQDQRTPEEIHTVQIGLRGVETFVLYPMRMQRKLCKVGWYECYGPGRAVVRQGHQPRAFYFILSGSVVVTYHDSKEDVTHTVCFLNSGLTFGELAILHRTVRNSNVITRTVTELLVISRKDYEDIFMCDGGIKNVTDPDHNAFMRSIQFLKGWPIDRIGDNADAVLFSYFSRGTVLVTDSKYSDWIYIVKSGSLSVWKKLKQPSQEDEAIMAVHAAQNTGATTWSTYPKKGGKGGVAKHRRPIHDPQALKALKRQLEAEIIPGLNNVTDRLGVVNYDEVLRERKYKLYHPFSPPTGFLPPIFQKGSKRNQTKSEVPQQSKQGPFLVARHGSSEGSKTTSDDKSSAKAKKKSQFQRKTLAQLLESTKAIANIDESGGQNIFIEIQILERGSYFGLADSLFEEQPSLCLISSGCECVMIKKEYFFQHCSPGLLENLRRTEIPFPKDNVLQDKLLRKKQWEKYKGEVMRKVDKERRRRDFFLSSVA